MLGAVLCTLTEELRGGRSCMQGQQSWKWTQNLLVVSESTI